MPKTEKKLTFTEYTAMKAADLFKHVAEVAVKPVEALNRATDKVVSNLKDAAKAVAAMKRLHMQRVEAREIPGDTPFKKFFKDNVGGELPGRVEALASLFNALVLTLDANGKPLIAEEIYDDEGTPVDWLEKASAIVNAAREKHGEAWKTCDEVLDMVNALTKPGDAGKKLKDIRERQKGIAEKDDEDEGKPVVAITPALAAEYLIAAIKQATEKTADEQYDLCCAVWNINNAWAALPDKLTRALDAKYQKAAKHGVAPHVEVVTAEAA
ncbi:MAG TPA: hypothetical protein PKA41_15110 [Verrucomicrobiota bacterium]|nr:hypothetical protein [Verrucomicrobiota bacterium]